MIKRFLVIFTAILILASPLAVRADLVIGNDFLYKNESNAEQIGERHYGKNFIINSPAGYVIPKKEPGSGKGVSTEMHSYKGTSPGGRNDKPYTYSGDVFVFNNGEIITITHTYLHKGKYWGVMSYSHTYQPPGWIPMDELLVLYDSQDFETLNKDNFYTYTGSYDAVLSAKKLVEWEWPGSDKEKRIVESYIPERAGVLYAYKDKDGREWGKTKYSEYWICLSDPENSKIPSFYPALQPTAWSFDGIHEWSADVTVYPPSDISGMPYIVTSDGPVNILLLIISLVAALFLCTVVLIIVFWKRNKGRGKE